MRTAILALALSWTAAGWRPRPGEPLRVVATSEDGSIIVYCSKGVSAHALVSCRASDKTTLAEFAACFRRRDIKCGFAQVLPVESAK